MTHLNKILITGTSSGLGKFLYEKLDGAQKFDRNNLSPTTPTNIIIHCGWEYGKPNTQYYIQDAIELFQILSKISHIKFIFLSTIDIYPKNNTIHYEEELIDPRNILGIYGLGKFIVEKFVEKLPNYTILRLSSLLGKYTLNNNIKRLSRYEDIDISLDSEFNFITYEQVLHFINLIILKDIKGIYNIASKTNIILRNINELVFDGTYIYKCGHISNTKLVKTGSKLTSSYENYKNWIKI